MVVVMVVVVRAPAVVLEAAVGGYSLHMEGRWGWLCSLSGWVVASGAGRETPGSTLCLFKGRKRRRRRQWREEGKEGRGEKRRKTFQHSSLPTTDQTFSCLLHCLCSSCNEGLSALGSFSKLFFLNIKISTPLISSHFSCSSSFSSDEI